MKNGNYFKDLFESLPEYRNLVLILFLIKKDVDILHECGFVKNDNNCVCLEFKKILVEQIEEFLFYMKDQEESIIDRTLNKQMEAYFATMFEDIRHEKSLILLPWLTDPDILKQSQMTDEKFNIIRNLAPEKNYIDRSGKRNVSLYH